MPFLDKIAETIVILLVFIIITSFEKHKQAELQMLTGKNWACKKDF